MKLPGGGTMKVGLEIDAHLWGENPIDFGATEL